MPTEPSRALPFEPDDPSLPWGLRRFGRHLASFQQKLDASHAVPEQATRRRRGYVHRPRHAEAMRGHRLHASGGRPPLFMLEGLCRITLGTGGDERLFEPLLSSVKVLEDALGGVDFWFASLEAFERLSLPPPLADWAATHHAHACGKLEGALEAGDWVEHRYLPEETRALRSRTVARALMDTDWHGPKKERQRLAEFLGNRLRRAHDAVRELDLGDLENGVHELRRKVRWFSIYAACLGGAVTLDRNGSAPRGWDRYLRPDVVNNPFNQLPAAPDGVRPIVIPAPLFYALSWAIAELGAIKERAQLTETVATGLQATGVRASTRRLLGSAATTHAAAGVAARRVLEQTLIDDKLLLRIADAVDAQARAR